MQNIKDALEVFEDWLKNFEKLNLGKENRPYLPLASVQVLSALKEKYGVEDKKADAFIAAYESVGGDYKHLRTVSSEEDKSTWDIVRNAALKELLNTIDDESPEMWGDDELPTKEHLEIILWAYSPDASKIKKNISKFEEKLGKKEDSKKKSSDSEESEEERERSSKRRSSSSSEEESPKKKSRK